MSKSLGKRILAITLSVLMVMTLLPTGMFAADSVEVTADNYQELLNVPLSVNSYVQDHVSWNWNGNGWNSTTLGGTVSIDEDWFGDTYDSILTSDNTSEWTTYPSFCISITDGGYLTESDKEVGYTGEEHTYNFTYSDIVIAANGYNDVVISGATVETVFQFIQYDGYTGGASYDIDLLTPIMEQTGLKLQEVAEEYIPAIYNVKFSATLNSFDGVSYSDIQDFIATLDEGGSGETGDTGDTGEYDLSGYTLSYSEDINLAASNYGWYTFSDTAIVDAMATEGSKFVVTRSTSVTEANYDKFGLVDEWFSMSMDWLNLGTAISKAADETGTATVIDCEFDNGVTVVYDGTTIYNALVAAGFYNGGAAQFISNTSSQTYTITNVSVYVPTTTSTSTVLPWELTSTDYVNDWNEMTFYQTAINGFTYGGYQWSTLIQNNNSSNYSESLALWDGFIEALLSDNAVFEITSTSANTHIILQAGESFGYGLGVYVYADSVVDNGDGTYTTTISCASALSAFASATQEGYEGSPAVPTSTSDYGDLFGLVISSSDESATLLSFKIVESTASSGGDSGDEETEATDTSSWVVVLQGFDTEYSGWAYTTLSDAGVLSYSVPLQTILDANNLDLADLGGVQFSVNGLTLTEDGSAGISDGVTLYYRVYINDELYMSSSSEIVTDTTWSSYTFLTLNYEANFGWDNYYNYSADDVFYVEVSLTAFDDEDEPIEVYEFPIDIEGYSTISYAEMTEGGTITILDGVDFTDNNLYLAIVYEGIDSSSEYYGYGAGWICTNSWTPVIGNYEAAPDAYKQLVNIDENGYILIPLTTIAEAFEASVSDDPEDGVVLNWWGNGWGATLYGVELLSKDITTEDILAANQEMIDNLTALLLSYDDVVYINQSDADDFNGYFSAGWSEICASSWDWDEIASVWTTSLGDEATVVIDYSDYVAPVAGTLDDLDGTDGSITLTYYADVGDPEAGTYVASQTYTVTIVIKATQLYHVDTPTDPDGRFTVTTSADYAYEGDEVTITIETAEGYKVSEVRAWYQDDDGNTNSLGITYYEDTGVWSITMPAYDIWVAVTVGTLDVNYAYDSDAVYLVDGVTSANEGDVVTFYVFVNRGYELDGEITAVDENGNTVTLTEVYSGLSVMNYKPSTAYAYSLTMPDSSVTITATSFKAIDGFIDGAFYITDCDEISFIDQVDFTDSDTYLVISYDLMFESDENVDNYGDWSPGGIFAVSDTGEWIQLCEIQSYNSSNGTYAISLTDIAALASDAGCNIDTYGVIIVWWVYDDEYASEETFTLVSADYSVNTEVVGNIVSGDGADVSVYGLPNEGSTITVTITPDAGYVLGSVVATDANGNEIALTVTDCGIHKYTFTMPDADVTVKATLIPESELSEIASWYGYGYVYNLSEDGILDNEYTDYDNEALYLCFNYDYSTFDDYYLGSIGYGVGRYWDQLCNIPAYECGHTYISLSELAAAAAELGYVGDYYFYIGGIDTDSMVYTIVTSEDLLEVNVEGCEGITSVDVNGYRKEGKTITFFVDVADGYIIKSFTATDAEGNEVELTRNYMTGEDACYTFTMPATDVTLKAETVLQSDLTTIVTESGAGVFTDGSPVFYSQYVDFTDENLYLTINYEAKEDHEGETLAVVAYGDVNYDYDSTVYQDVVRLVDNGTGTVSVSLTDIQAAVEATGLTSGYYYLWEYTTISSVSIDTLDTYTPAESSVGELITIDGVDYEVTWDTTTPNPISTYYLVNNVIGWSSSLYTDWWTISQSFKEAVVSHLSDGSLIQVVSDDTIDYDLAIWLQLYDESAEEYPILYWISEYADNTAYTSLDEIASVATEKGYEITTDTINSLLLDGFYETGDNYIVITDVRILTPLTYEVDSVTWATDYSSATVKLVAGTHTQYVTVTDVTSATTAATCTANGSTVYTAIAAYNGQTFEVSTTVEIPAIGHTEAEAVEENRVAATCTEDGSYDSVVYCSVCGAELSRETVTIPATGHSYEAVVTDPTCTESGYTTYTCSICGDSYTADETEATGHDYGEPEWTWDGYTSATATFTCGNDSTHVEVVTAEITSATTAATCEEDGETVYTASVTFNGETYTTTTTEVLSAIDHDWTVSYEWSEDGKTCTATHVCANDAEHNVSETVTTSGTETIAPTCTEMGTTTYTATFTSDWAETKTMDVVDVEALGHDWSVEYTWSEDGSSCTVTHVCANDASHNETASATVTSEVTLEATCETDGQTTYTATFDVDWAESQETTITDIEATGHDWSVEYSWSEDGSSCTATHVCANDSEHNVSETVTTEGAVTTDPTCTEMGTTTYTATFTSDWAETKTMDVVDVEALGHDWSVEYTWSTDGKSCTATHVCGRDSTHNESETVTTSGTETIAPTCTEKGTTTYTATFDADWAEETQTLDVQDIDALGHTYGDPEFTWDEEAYTATATFSCTIDGCDGATTVTADVTSATSDATCTEDGKTVYTAVVVVNEIEYTDTYEVVIPATGHTTEIQNAKAATCTEDGYTGDEVCTVCGETITVGTVISAIGHSFDSNGVCTTCGAKTGTESTSSSVTVSSGDTIFADVLSSGLVTSVEVTVSNDNSGAVIISEVVEGTAEPHLVGHIAVDALNFTLYNSSQEDDLISNTSSFNITTTKENKTVIEKVSVLFYGDVDYSGQGTSTVTMKFTGSDLSESTIYVLHYTGTYPEWETVTHTVTTSGTTTTIEFETDSFSPYVVLSVANVSSSDSNSTILDLLLRISADYSSVNEAIARANALDPNDYENFSAVTEAINAVNWNLKAINQLTVNAYADAINTAIDNLVVTTANITEETVEIIDPIEGTDTDTEEDDESPETFEPETNPTTGIAFSILPMVIATLVAVSAKRR